MQAPVAAAKMLTTVQETAVEPVKVVASPFVNNLGREIAHFVAASPRIDIRSVDYNADSTRQNDRPAESRTLHPQEPMSTEKEPVSGKEPAAGSRKNTPSTLLKNEEQETAHVATALRRVGVGSAYHNTEFPAQVDGSGEPKALQIRAPISAEKEPASAQEPAARSLSRVASALMRNLGQEANHLLAARHKADAECERKLIELRELVQAETNLAKETLRGAAQASERLERLSAGIEGLQQEKLRYFQSQAEELLNRHAKELRRRSEGILEEIIGRTYIARSATRLNPATAILMAGLVVLLAAVLGSYHQEVGRSLTWLGQVIGDQGGTPTEGRAAAEELAPPQEQPAGGLVLGKEPRALWARVAKDDALAEVALAKLYLAGEGVTKSCVQARLLLRAAADKGNAEAEQKLAQLNRKGCPLPGMP